MLAKGACSKKNENKKRITLFSLREYIVFVDGTYVVCINVDTDTLLDSIERNLVALHSSSHSSDIPIYVCECASM